MIPVEVALDRDFYFLAIIDGFSSDGAALNPFLVSAHPCAHDRLPLVLSSRRTQFPSNRLSTRVVAAMMPRGVADAKTLWANAYTSIREALRVKILRYRDTSLQALYKAFSRESTPRSARLLHKCVEHLRHALQGPLGR